MSSAEAEEVLHRHWPEFTGHATYQLGRFAVYLVPRSRLARRRAELSAYSADSFGAALLDLATWSSPTLRCRDPNCVLCGRQ
jgi:hypothetical protein